MLFSWIDRATTKFQLPDCFPYSLCEHFKTKSLIWTLLVNRPRGMDLYLYVSHCCIESILKRCGRHSAHPCHNANRPELRKIAIFHDSTTMCMLYNSIKYKQLSSLHSLTCWIMKIAFKQRFVFMNFNFPFWTTRTTQDTTSVDIFYSSNCDTVYSSAILVMINTTIILFMFSSCVVDGNVKETRKITNSKFSTLPWSKIPSAYETRNFA